MEGSTGLEDRGVTQATNGPGGWELEITEQWNQLGEQ